MTSYLKPRPGSAAVAADGSATVTFEIDNTNARWVIDEVTVQTSQAPGSVPVPQARLYLNFPGQQEAFQGGSNSGNMDTAAGRVVLYAGDILYVIWSGGIPGTKATAIIGGTFDPAGSA
jgi:hypothetical protein